MQNFRAPRGLPLTFLILISRVDCHSSLSYRYQSICGDFLGYDVIEIETNRRSAAFTGHYLCGNPKIRGTQYHKNPKFAQSLAAISLTALRTQAKKATETSFGPVPLLNTITTDCYSNASRIGKGRGARVH